DWEALGNALRTAHAGHLLGVAGVTVLVYLARAWRWGYLLDPLGHVGFADLFSATMVGFASGLLVPRAAELVRPYLVSRRYPIARRLGPFPGWRGEAPVPPPRAVSQGLAGPPGPALHLLAILGQSFVVWLLIGLSFHLNHLAFGLTLPVHATFLLTAFLTVGVAIPTPGTVGGFHAFYLLCLTEAFGIPKGTAAAAGIAAHALANLPLLGSGLVLMGREGLTLGKVVRMTADEP